jgi:membrane-bound metal-dependent hydrolase YbcI (DUF457 family)
VVVFGAYAAHIIEDQLGHMGSNLWFPFSRTRAPGLRRMHSGDALPNFFCVWLCCLLIFWNVYAAIPEPLYQFNFLRLILTAMVIPFAVFGGLRWLLRRSGNCSAESVCTQWDV